MKRFLLLVLVFIILIPSISNSQSLNIPIVFVSRNHETNGNILYPQAGLLPGMGAFSRFKVVGGKLMVRDELGNVTTLIDSTMKFGDVTLIDIQQPCVYWNGQKIVFCPRAMSRFEIIISGEQMEVFSSDNDAVVKKEAFPTSSSDFEPALIDSSPGSKRTRS